MDLSYHTIPIQFDLELVNCQLAAELLREIVGEGRLKAKVEPLLT